MPCISQRHAVRVCSFFLALAVFLACNGGGEITSNDDLPSEAGRSAIGDSLSSYMDLCWPIEGDCKDRELNQNEHNRVTLLSERINVAGDPRCAAIMAQSAQDAQDGKIRMWTEGPTGYDPRVDPYAGDRHNTAGVTHVTPNAWVDNYELMKTLIHEAAHAVGYTSDEDAIALEYACMGTYEI